MSHGGRWRIGLMLALIATTVRLAWTLAVPTIPVGDFATYRESAIYLAEFGHLDAGFVYMPGLIWLLAVLHALGGEVLAAKMLGVLFGGLAAWPLYIVASRLLVNGQRSQPGQAGLSEQPGRPGLPVQPDLTGVARSSGGAALVAGLGYALWPAGIALSSVIGTDIPTAAIILLALSLLCSWGDTRPLLASAAFGAAMGVAAYFRAVALPLAILSATYWWVRRVGLRATIGRTALAMSLTVLLLLPWGLRNRRQSGEFYLTDSHGGITALMGNDPNTEGTYSRSLGAMFLRLTGRTFLTEPHRETDRVAYRLAVQFMKFDPAWTCAMVALRIERLFAPERGLLYWSVYRPGVVPPATAAWFNQHRPVITALADWYYLLFVFCLCAGLAFAVVDRRWSVLVPLPFALTLAVTYALFVAEPRYRVTTEVLLFPIAGFGAWRFGGAAVLVAQRWWRIAARRSRIASVVGPPSGRDEAPDADAPRGLAATAATVAFVIVGSLALGRGGAALRTRHRWAATVWQVDGRPELALWRGGTSVGGPSPVWGAPPGAVLRIGPGQGRVDAEIILPDIKSARGSFQMEASLGWRGAEPGGASVTIGGVSVDSHAIAVRGSIEQTRGPLRIGAHLDRPAGADGFLEVVISEVTLTTAGAP